MFLNRHQLFHYRLIGLAGVVLLGLLSTLGSGGGGGGGSNGGNGGATVSGSVLAPQGQIALINQRDLLDKFSHLLFPTASAAVTGLLPVPDGTTVNLVRLDDAGMISAILASTTTAGGNYSFDLEELGLGYANNLAVTVSSGPVEMHAFVTDSDTDITPLSEACYRIVLNQIASVANTTLANFTLTELRDIYAAIDLLSSLEEMNTGFDIESTVNAVINEVNLMSDLTAFLLAAVESGQTSVGPGDIGNLIPAEQDDTWNAIWTSSDIASPYLSETQVNGTTWIGGTLTTNFVESNMDNSLVPSTEYIVKDKLGLTYWGNDLAEDFITPQIIPFLQVRFPLHIGETTQLLHKTNLVWMEDLDGDSQFESFDVDVVSTTHDPEPINVQAGQFPLTIPVEINITANVTLSSLNMDVVSTSKVKQWVAPEVGKVKQTLITEARIQDVITSETSDAELLGYSVGGVGHGVLSKFPIANSVADANSDTTSPGRAGVATDGTDYLVVTCRQAAWGPPSGLIGVIVSPDKTVSPEFSLTTHTCQFPNPAIAFDGSNYLVVFSKDAQISGVFVSPSGTVGTVFPISADQISNFSPRIAFDGTNYMVVWQKFVGTNGYDIQAARMQPDGTVLNEFTVFSASGEQLWPALAFDGANYLVVWQDTRDGSGPSLSTDIYGTRVSPAGIVLDSPEIPIVTIDNFQGEPEIAFDGSNYLVTWLDTDTFMDPVPGGIYGRRINTSGTLLDGNATDSGIPLNTASYGKGNRTLVFNGTNYFLAWRAGAYTNDPPAGIYFARISPSGTLLGIGPNDTGLIASGLPPDYSKLVYPAFASNGESSLLVWTNNIELSGTQKSVEAAFVFPW